MAEDEIAILKRYIDAKVAHAIRQQAWLKLSWTAEGKPEKAALESAEREVNNLMRPKPVDREHYSPLESPRMYPLELDDHLHISLWSEDGNHKWTIAAWVKGGEGYDLQFLRERPFDPRVNWSDFKSIVRQGQALADKRYEEQRLSE